MRIKNLKQIRITLGMSPYSTRVICCAEEILWSDSTFQKHYVMQHKTTLLWITFEQLGSECTKFRAFKGTRKVLGQTEMCIVLRF